MTDLIILLIPILIAVESGGDWKMKGDFGQAHGALQIHQVVIDDYNNLIKADDEPRLTIKAAKNPQLARFVAYRWLKYWGEKYRQETGREPTAEIFCRMWNGGPKGYEKWKTRDHWQKCLAQL
jgi:hypothetical protein